MDKALFQKQLFTIEQTQKEHKHTCTCFLVRLAHSHSYCTVIMKMLLIYSTRYGLPVNFCSVVLKPHRKSQKKTEDILKDQYGYLDSKFVANEADVSGPY